MNKILYYRLRTWCVVGLCIAATACNKSTPAPTTEELIIGKWYVEKIVQADGSLFVPKNDCEKDSHFRFDDENEIDLVNFYLVDGECKRSGGWGEYQIVQVGGEEKLFITASDGVTSTVDILTINATVLVLKVEGDVMHLRKRNRD